MAIEANILVLLEGLLQAKALGLSTLTIEGNLATVILMVINEERGFWKLDNWMHKILDIVSELGCSLS